MAAILKNRYISTSIIDHFDKIWHSNAYGTSTPDSLSALIRILSYTAA